jgi:plastocyanin
MLKKFLHINSTLALLAIALSCAGSGTTGPNGSGGTVGGGNAACPANTFCLRASSFDPTSLTVPVGTAVTWDNQSGVTHNVVFTDPTAANSVGTGPPGDIGQTSSGADARSFAKAGNYAFHCTIHAGMIGSVTVQ